MDSDLGLETFRSLSDSEPSEVFIHKENFFDEE